MNVSVGMKSLAVSLPDQVRTNDYWRQHYPDAVAAHEERTLARLFATTQRAGSSAEPWDAEVSPYLADPFRGTVERRVLGPDETSLDLEVRAARRTLAAARMSPGDVDLALVTSFHPNIPGVGNAALLVRALQLKCPAWNVESTCSSSLAALQMASALIATGDHRNVLVVTSCVYSRVADLSDSLSWFLGDGAGAFVVGPTPAGVGVLATHTVHTAETCDTFYHALENDPVSGPAIRIRCQPETQRILRENSPRYLKECCEGAVRKAGFTIADVDLFVFNTPTAWFAAVGARTLGVDPARTVDTYPRYANVGPALMPINLHHAASEGRIRPGQLVLLFTIGSASTASAALLRWGDVAV